MNTDSSTNFINNCDIYIKKKEYELQNKRFNHKCSR